MCLQPIETVYRGYRFRSRTEARWAVFFDSLRIRYAYEGEGFNLGGLWYLPDFALPDAGPRVWVEIKGEFPTDPQEQTETIHKMLELCARSREPVLMFIGTPYPGEHRILYVACDPATGDLFTALPDGQRVEPIVLAESDCGAVYVAHFSTETSRMISTTRLRKPTRACPKGRPCDLRMGIGAEAVAAGCPDLWRAFGAARRARFEHGAGGQS